MIYTGRYLILEYDYITWKPRIAKMSCIAASGNM